jgi:methanogenic corrinoid protein MtbC1/DNA-binding XRE family transcriptional regulator
LDAILSGDETSATLVVQEGIQKGISPIKLYLELLIPCQYEVGQRWHDGEVNVAQEHMATLITLSQMERLKQWFHPETKLGLKAVICSVEGDHHLMGARVISDFMYADGWDVSFLGANMPTSDLVDYVRQNQVDLVALSITLPEVLNQAEKGIGKLKRLKPTPKIMVGGLAFYGQQHLADEMGADGVALEGLEAIRVARELMSLESDAPTLPEYLKQLGQRVQTLRKSHGWSQQQLAKASGLDRTYISAVEHGKQNLTVGAISKLSEALQVPITHLMMGEPRSQATE